jgi:hypothetical protein
MSIENENGNFAKPMLGDVFFLFVGKDKFRPAMHKPFEINGKVYATDAYTLVRTDKANIEFFLDNEHNPPNCEGVIPEVNTSLILNITKEMFETLKTADEYEIAGKDIECKTCEGSGEVEWDFEHYTRDFECPVCEGAGWEEQKTSRKTGGKTFGKCIVKINDACFHIDKFYKLIKVRDILGGEIELISYSKSTSGVLFKIGVCEILLMTVICGDASDWDAVLNIA